MAYVELPSFVAPRVRMPRIGVRAHRRSLDRLARWVEHVIDRAEQRPSPFGSAVPVDREAVRRAHRELLDLAERLRAPRHVEPDGVALVRRLLTDGAGPLYVPGHVDELRGAVLRALDALDGSGGER